MERAVRRLRVVSTVVFGLTALCAVAPATAQPKPPPTDFSGLPEKISGDAIKTEWFDGRPFLAIGPDGAQYQMVFTADGKSVRTPVGVKKPKPTTGFWRVIAEGYCSRWAGSNREKCFNVRKSPDGAETVVRFGAIVAATWRRP